MRSVAAASEARQAGLTRGEMDGEMFVMGWSTRNIPQALYWSGLFATHCRLDVWNIPSKALKDEANLPAFSFFNKYAGRHDPATAPRRFLRPARRIGRIGLRSFSCCRIRGQGGKKTRCRALCSNRRGLFETRGSDGRSSQSRSVAA